MGRILFFVGLAVLMWVAWAISRRNNKLDNEERRELRRLRREKAEGEKRAERTRALGEMMVKCAHCGTYFPKSEGVRRGDRLYCSVACRDKAKDSHGADPS